MEVLSDLDKTELITVSLEFGEVTIAFLLLLALTFFVAGWVRRLTLSSLSRSGMDTSLAQFFSKVAKFVVLIAGIISCLGVFGIETASFAAVLAAAGFAVGMALQGTLGHFASGVMLLVFKPFKPGQFIKVAGVSGTVAEIDLFSTVLDTPDNRRIIVPNGSVFGSQIENVSFHDLRRVDVSVGTSYSANLDETKSVLLKAAGDVQHCLRDPGPEAVLTGLGASSVDWSVRIWVNAEDFWPASEALTSSVKKALDEAQISIPFPQVDVNVPEGFWQGSHGLKESSEKQIQ